MPTPDDILRFPTAVKQSPRSIGGCASNATSYGHSSRPGSRGCASVSGDVRELMHDGCPTACVGDASFGYVAAYKEHVNVGFFFGALLHDPGRLLEGTGKRGRHVKLRPGRDIDSAALARLVDAAYADIRARLGK